jgi:hypothetical protein
VFDRGDKFGANPNEIRNSYLNRKYSVSSPDWALPQPVAQSLGRSDSGRTLEAAIRVQRGSLRGIPPQEREDKKAVRAAETRDLKAWPVAQLVAGFVEAVETE